VKEKFEFESEILEIMPPKENKNGSKPKAAPKPKQTKGKGKDRILQGSTFDLQFFNF